MSQLIYSGTPTLPHTFEYTPVGDERVMLSLSGTAWTVEEKGKIGLELVIDEQVVTSAWVYSNSPTEHRALHTGLSEYNFPLKYDANKGIVEPVSITIRTFYGTLFDGNDIVTIAIV